MYIYILVHVSYARVLKLCENPASVPVTQSYLFSYLILVIILMTKAIYFNCLFNVLTSDHFVHI